MPYHNCNYLFLHETQRDGTIWNNLPTLPNSRRECYVTICEAKLVFDDVPTQDSINIKMVIPTLNYTSSSNDSPMVAMLDTDPNNKKVYSLDHENNIHILTNDALKKVEFILEDNNGAVVTIDAADSFEVMLKIEYIDQAKETESYLSEIPKLL